MAKKVKVALIDAHAPIHRAYHALPPMSTGSGRPTNAIYGFTTMLLKMFSTLKPTHVVAAFDVKGPTFRHQEFSGYKAHRAKAPDDLTEQFDGVRRVLVAFGIPCLDKQGYEADDIIGTLVEMLDHNVKKIIVTGDMDTLQLIDDHTSVFTLKRGVSDTILYDEQIVKEKYGFGPEHITDYKGLRGDPSDNIPGVKGVGDKTAKDLVATYGSIEGIYQHLGEMPSRVQTRLQGKEKEALFSRKLATIHRDVPIDFSLEEAVLTGYDEAQVRSLFEELEFRSLLNRLPQGGTGAQPSLLAHSDGASVTLPPHYHLASTAPERRELRRKLLEQSVIAVDTETEHLGPRSYPIVGMSFAFREGARKKIQSWYVPVNPHTVQEWQDILENPTIQKTGHNLKYDMEVFQQSRIQLQGIIFDSMIAAYVLNPGRRSLSLDALAAEELGHHTIPISDLIGEGKNQKLLSDVPLLELARYAAEDADISFQLYELLAPHITKQGLTRVLEDIEIPLLPVLVAMELQGVKVDTGVLQELNKKVKRKIAACEKKIWKAAAQTFNINSTQQLRAILFETLKL
ncbi:MAG: 5'-3' exonuclease H3TH domain-containing protein, partial [Acidobacteriota bacterium]